MTLSLSLGLALLAQTPATASTDVLAEPLATTFKESKLSFTDIPSFVQMRYVVGKRQHTIYVRKQPDAWNSLKIHEALGIVWESDSPPEGALLMQAFSQRYSIGGLVYEVPGETQKKYRLRFRIDVPANIAAPKLIETLSLVASTSDLIESQLNTGKEDIY